MTPTEALEKVLPAYERYYNVARSAPAPFAATAEFHSHGEKYLLIRQAKIWDMDSHEYVYFAARDAAARTAIRRTHRSLGYQHGLQGWSNLRIGAIELSDGRITTNRHGKDLKKLLSNIFQNIR